MLYQDAFIRLNTVQWNVIQYNTVTSANMLQYKFQKCSNYKLFCFRPLNIMQKFAFTTSFYSHLSSVKMQLFKKNNKMPADKIIRYYDA